MGIFSKPRLQNLDRREDTPEGLWSKCPQCESMLHKLELQQNLQVCHHCSHHFLLGSRERIALFADEGTFEETDVGLVSSNPLGSKGMPRKPRSSARKPDSTTRWFPAGLKSAAARQWWR